MAFVDLDSLHYYQPPPSAVRPLQKRSAAWNRGASSNAHEKPMAGAPNISASARLEDFNLIEYVHSAASIQVESLANFDFEGTEMARGDSHIPR